MESGYSENPAGDFLRGILIEIDSAEKVMGDCGEKKPKKIEWIDARNARNPKLFDLGWCNVETGVFGEIVVSEDKSAENEEEADGGVSESDELAD